MPAGASYQDEDPQPTKQVTPANVNGAIDNGREEGGDFETMHLALGHLTAPSRARARTSMEFVPAQMQVRGISTAGLMGRIAFGRCLPVGSRCMDVEVM